MILTNLPSFTFFEDIMLLFILILNAKSSFTLDWMEHPVFHYVNAYANRKKGTRHSVFYHVCGKNQANSVVQPLLKSLFE